LARQFSQQANGDRRMKAIWWLNALNGQHNNFHGTVHAYEPVYGAGCAVVGLLPTAKPTEAAEYDEDEAETYGGDRNVLGGNNLFESAVDGDDRDDDADGDRDDDRDDGDGDRDHREGVGAGNDGEAMAMGRQVKLNATTQAGVIQAAAAPKPVGAYPHARRVGEFLYLSGLGPRNPADNSIPGGPVWNAKGKKQVYDIEAQTEAVIANMKTVLASAGATLADVVDCTCYLIDMERDFAGFNKVYSKHFGDVQATRTTLEINRLPTPIAVEFKAIAKAPQ